MKTKILLLLSVGLNVTLLGATVYLSKQIPEVTYAEADPWILANRGVGTDAPGVTGRAYEIQVGTVVETVLPTPENGARAEMLDLESGKTILEPPFEFFGSNARANIAWIQANGLDLSGVIIGGSNVMCIGYYLAAVPMPPQIWDEPPLDPLSNSALAAIHDPKRTVLTYENGKNSTYLFRTAEGTPGILQVLGTTDDLRSVKIRYKLLSAPLSSISDQPGRKPDARVQISFP